MHVVADEDERSLVLLERADEGVDGPDIQVRGRLVHEQEIWRIEQQLDERKARFFSAAEDRDWLEYVVAPKEERAENRPGDLFAGRVFHILHALQNGVPGIEHFHAVLREIADFDVVPQLALAALERQVAGEEFD